MSAEATHPADRSAPASVRRSRNEEVDGVSEKMLAQTLQALVRDGLVERRVYPVIPPHTDYG